MKSLDWAHLPEAGGVLDQSEAAWEDLQVVQWRYQLLEKLWQAGELMVTEGMGGGIQRDFRKPDSGIEETL